MLTVLRSPSRFLRQDRIKAKLLELIQVTTIFFFLPLQAFSTATQPGHHLNYVFTMTNVSFKAKL